jgi:hypothetical protein
MEADTVQKTNYTENEAIFTPFYSSISHGPAACAYHSVTLTTGGTSHLGGLAAYIHVSGTPVRPSFLNSRLLHQAAMHRLQEVRKNPIVLSLDRAILRMTFLKAMQNEIPWKFIKQQLSLTYDWVDCNKALPAPWPDIIREPGSLRLSRVPPSQTNPSTSGNTLALTVGTAVSDIDSVPGGETLQSPSPLQRRIASPHAAQSSSVPGKSVQQLAPRDPAIKKLFERDHAMPLSFENLSLNGSQSAIQSPSTLSRAQTPDRQSRPNTTLVDSLSPTKNYDYHMAIYSEEHGIPYSDSPMPDVDLETGPETGQSAGAFPNDPEINNGGDEDVVFGSPNSIHPHLGPPPSPRTTPTAVSIIDNENDATQVFDPSTSKKTATDDEDEETSSLTTDEDGEPEVDKDPPPDKAEVTHSGTVAGNPIDVDMEDVRRLRKRRRVGDDQEENAEQEEAEQGEPKPQSKPRRRPKAKSKKQKQKKLKLTLKLTPTQKEDKMEMEMEMLESNKQPEGFDKAGAVGKGTNSGKWKIGTGSSSRTRSALKAEVKRVQYEEDPDVEIISMTKKELQQRVAFGARKQTVILEDMTGDLVKGNGVSTKLTADVGNFVVSNLKVLLITISSISSS